MLTANRIKELLDLRPLPEEGGYYAESYRTDPLPAAALPDRYAGPRPFKTAIYYLLAPDTFSAMHRLPTDELFHFYLGDSVEQLHLYPNGTGRVVRIGPDLLAGERPQVLAPRGVWQGARLAPGGSHGYSLLGTTMAPGFDVADYEGGRREDLIASYPAFRELIEALTV